MPLAPASEELVEVRALEQGGASGMGRFLRQNMGRLSGDLWRNVENSKILMGEISVIFSNIYK